MLLPLSNSKAATLTSRLRPLQSPNTESPHESCAAHARVPSPTSPSRGKDHPSLLGKTKTSYLSASWILETLQEAAPNIFCKKPSPGPKQGVWGSPLFYQIAPFHRSQQSLKPQSLVLGNMHSSSSSSVAQSCPTLCDPMNRSTPGLPVPHHLLRFAQAHVHCISDAIQPSHPLMLSSPSSLNLSQHQGLFQ